MPEQTSHQMSIEIPLGLHHPAAFYRGSDSQVAEVPQIPNELENYNIQHDGTPGGNLVVLSVILFFVWLWRWLWQGRNRLG